MRGNAGLNTAKKEERRMSGSYELQLLKLFRRGKIMRWFLTTKKKKKKNVFYIQII